MPETPVDNIIAVYVCQHTNLIERYANREHDDEHIRAAHNSIRSHSLNKLIVCVCVCARPISLASQSRNIWFLSKTPKRVRKHKQNTIYKLICEASQNDSNEFEETFCSCGTQNRMYIVPCHSSFDMSAKCEIDIVEYDGMLHDIRQPSNVGRKS